MADLLSLPPELRLVIWTTVFADAGPITEPPPLMFTCTTIWRETIPYWLAKLRRIAASPKAAIKQLDGQWREELGEPVGRREAEMDKDHEELQGACSERLEAVERKIEKLVRRRDVLDGRV